jgi:lysophospholipase L1-like esterase
MNKALKYILIGSGVALAAIGVYYAGKKLNIFSKSNKINKNKVLKNILFVGDSMTAGINTSYSYLIKNQLSDKNVDILAQVGKQTSWMLQNLQTQFEKQQYDRVYIWGGVNDIASGISKEQATANVQAMVDMINTQGGEAIVIVGYDATNFMTVDNMKPSASFPNGVSNTTKNNYIAYQNYLQNNINNAVIEPAFELNPSLNADGIHPNAVAQQQIASILMQNIS